MLLGGDGNDLVDGQQGNDAAFLGAGADTFQWDPGDGSDVVEGQDGVDKLAFNGSSGNELLGVSANGSRARFTRILGAIVMDLAGVETIAPRALGGADTVTVDDLTGTGVTTVAPDLAGAGGVDDAVADNVIVNGTNGNDVIALGGSGRSLDVSGLAAPVKVTGAGPGVDRVTVNALAGNDVIDATHVAIGSALLALNGGDGDDVIAGGAGDDALTGGLGFDVLLGGPGTDTIDGGVEGDVVVQSVTVEDGRTVVRAGGRKWTLPNAAPGQVTPSAMRR